MGNDIVISNEESVKLVTLCLCTISVTSELETTSTNSDPVTVWGYQRAIWDGGLAWVSLLIIGVMCLEDVVCISIGE